MDITEALQQAIDTIEADIPGATVEAAARAACYSMWHFNRLFAQAVGMGPARYIRLRRLSEGALLLMMKGVTLYEAAAAVGFSSASVFVRAFAEEYGCPPGAWRRADNKAELTHRVLLKKTDMDWRCNTMLNVKWLDRENADEPFCHSYPAALYSALKLRNESVRLSDIMGDSGFAFRLDMHHELCPSATSIFDFEGELRFAAENTGVEAQRITRLWHQMDRREELRELAAGEIKKAVANGFPAVCWDALLPEWCLIAGWDEQKKAFAAIGPDGMTGALPEAMLGQREIEIMDVTIPGQPNALDGKARLKNAMKWAVGHARGRHWADRPNYEQGLAAWPMWAGALEKLAEGVLSPNGFEGYHCSMAASARLNASRYLASCAENGSLLVKATAAYEQMADMLCGIYKEYMGGNVTNSDRKRFAGVVRECGRLDEQAVCIIEKWLAD